MPRRRQRTGVDQRSTSASPEVTISHKEFSELRESVQGIYSRLEVLERVFVFVDIEEINDVLAKYHSDIPSGDKAGIDSVIAKSQWEALPRSRLHLDHCIPEESGDHCEKARRSSSGGASVPEGGLQNVLQSLVEAVGLQELAEAAAKIVEAEDAIADTQAPLATSAYGVGPEISSKFKHCISSWECPSLNAIDEDEQKSTCSSRTWDLCSTKDGFDWEADVEPELFHKFMKQALRPSWEARVKSTGRSISDDHVELVDQGSGFHEGVAVAPIPRVGPALRPGLGSLPLPNI